VTGCVVKNIYYKFIITCIMMEIDKQKI